MMADKLILVVEDEGIVAKDIQERLRRLGYIVPFVASTGEEAVRMAIEARPDIVLMDIMLSGEVNGIQAARRIRERFNIPVVYVTAYADDTTLESAKASEPYGYILKPIQDRELYSAIEIALYKHKVEVELKENRQWLAAVVRCIGDALVATDPLGAIRLMNPLAAQMVGWDQEEATGKNLLEVFKVMDGATQNFVESLSVEEIEGSMFHELEKDATLVTRNGIEIPVHEKISPIKDEQGNMLGVVLTFEDISGRKHAEEAMLQMAHQLARSNAELEKFAYEASYKLKEPLKLISGYAQLLGEKYQGKLGEEADSYIANIVNNAVHLQIQTSELLTRARSGATEKVLVEINAQTALNKACNNLRTAIAATGSRITSDKLPVVLANEIQLILLFQHLVDNAVKFRSQEEPRVHVSAEKAGYEWLFSVRDNGIGIDSKDSKRIFDLFQRLNPSEREGHGVGLTICKNIVELHGGRIWVDSEPAKGSAFYFTLPIQLA